MVPGARANTITIISIFFPPETGAAPVRISNMAHELKKRGCDVDVITAMPNYPKGEIFERYRGKMALQEEVMGIPVRRYWLYPSVSKNPIARVWSMVSFAMSLWMAFPYLWRRKPDVVIINSPPIFVGFSGAILSRICGAQTVMNISDIWPLSALELGVIKRGTFYSLLERIETFMYKNAHVCLAQSLETATHIEKRVPGKRTFLYRNLDKQSSYVGTSVEYDPNGFKIIYAGLLGVAQGVYELCRQVNFQSLGVEFHIYGAGNELSVIREYIHAHPRCGIFLHDVVPKEQMPAILSRFHATIIPLKSHIHGAFPSKISMALSAGLPIIFSGGGEGADIVRRYGLGLVSDVGDYATLQHHITHMKTMGREQYDAIRKNCLQACQADFDYDRQADALYSFLTSHT